MPARPSSRSRRPSLARRAAAAVLSLLAPLALTVAAPGVARADHTAAPTAVTIAGSLQSELGCPGDWQPDCAQTGLVYDAEDDLWQASFALPAGSYEYKAALNRSWDENYGAGAAANGPNVPLTLAAPATVTFFYSHHTHWVTSSINSAVATVAGDFQSEIGCTSDWKPDCLRSWLQDPDGDGTYTFTTSDLPAGTYAFKVARDQNWSVSYPDANKTFTVGSPSDRVTFSYDPSTNAVADARVERTSSGPEPGDEELARASLRKDLAGEKFYFVMPDRFANGSTANDDAGVTGSSSVNGFDPTRKGYYHGGDLAGLTAKLGYIQDLGTTAIWMTPMFKNKWVQNDGSEPDGKSAAYHGYWITDFTQIDPHFGTNAEMRAFIAAAHARGIKVFFDIITNHTADVIDYAEKQYSYRPKSTYPYVDANGREFDDRDYAGKANFPTLDLDSFPYTPVFPTAADATAKVPAWLNDRTLYHNRGDSTFVGENSLYGDFFGLDDLFTENPKVVDGMTQIFEAWISELGIDGYRIDTTKHVNIEFWQKFAPAVKAYAAAHGKPDFFMFGEVFDSDPSFTSQFTTKATLPSVLDFPFQSRARGFAKGTATNDLRDNLFGKDDLYTDADSNAYSLNTFLGNHDMGRIGSFVRSDNPGASDSELVSRDVLAHQLMYLSRGNPVVYYGDEQGFSFGATPGEGSDPGDKNAREDMFASKVASYNDNDLLGTDKTTATDSYGEDNPLFVAIRDLAATTAAHKALRTGAQIHRYSTAGPGVYAFSRIDADEQVEYVVALNNATAAQTVTVPTYSAGMGFSGVYPAGLAATTTAADKTLSVSVPALSAVVYRAAAPLAKSTAAPSVTLAPPPAGSEVKGKVEVGATVGGSGFNQVTFAARPQGQTGWTVIGTDDNPSYRVYYDVSHLPKGSTLELKAIVRDNAGHINADKISVTVGEEPPPPAPGTAPPRDYTIVHYQRPAGDYDGWGLYLFGDVDDSEKTTWPATRPFQGEDSYGRWTWVKLAPDAKNVGFIVQNNGTKDTDADRFVNPTTQPEIWLKQGDPKVYTSRAAAQGYVTVHYQRPAGDYAGWGVYVFGGVADSEKTTWPATRPFTGTDSFGRFANIALSGDGSKVGFIVQNNGVKDTDPDRFIDPATTSDVWINQGDEKVYPTQGAAEKYAVIHYHRADGDYTGWTIYHWTGSATPTPSWEASRAPDGTDRFGAYWKVPLLADATALNYIVHKGDTKDPGGDQSLDLAGIGNEAWFLSGDKDGSGKVRYVLPVVGGAGPDVDLTKAKAQWLTRDTLVWKVEPSASHSYSLRYSPNGDITADATGVRGGLSIRLAYDPAGLSPALKEMFPHLASYPTFKVRSGDLRRVPDALKGQIVAVDRDGDGALRAATAVQIPGVLDDLYAGAASAAKLGPTVSGQAVTLRLWAPTAQSVALKVFANGNPATPATTVPMSYDPASGVWSASAASGWQHGYYLYEVTVWAPSAGKVVKNLVTDPYSLGLSTNSRRSLVVDLNSAGTQPEDWADLHKPRFGRAVDSSIYELHVRDFSIDDATVPAAERGTFAAFGNRRSNGMRHLASLARTGTNTVHLLPAFDIATIEEQRSAQARPACDLSSYPPDSAEQQSCVMAVADKDGFNWGYDPLHYTTPEGSYSTDPMGEQRTREFREMVAALNRTGMRVVMDVVYNHTAASGQDPNSVLDRVVPGYYQRLNANGEQETSTCCANTASEHAMMGKLMIDSVVTWAKDYKVDGFRFDLMGHHTKQNMLDLRAALDRLTLARDGVDGKKIVLYGEGWNFGEVADNARFVQATQANMAGTGIGTFNDRLRDAVRGGGPFDGNPRIQGFGSGLYTDPNGDAVNGTAAEQKARLLKYQDQIKVGLTGNLKDYSFVDRTGATVKGSQVDYNGAPAGYTAEPQEAVTYVDAHDNETLYDALAYKLPQDTTMADRVRMQAVSLSTVLLGQGMAFTHAGAELLRSKSLDRNSFNSGDWFNRLDLSYSSNNFGVGLPPKGDNESKWDYMRPLLRDPDLRADRAAILSMKARYEELSQIRRDTGLLRLGTAAAIGQKLSFPIGGPAQTPGVIVMRVDDTVGPDADRAYENLVVVFNASPTAQDVAVPGLAGHHLRLHPVQARGSDAVVRTARVDGSGVAHVPARTTAVFVE